MKGRSPLSNLVRPLQKSIICTDSIELGSMAVIGSLTGVLGYTNFTGFGIYFISSLLISSLFQFYHCRSQQTLFVGRIIGKGLLDDLFGFILFWTVSSFATYSITLVTDSGD